MFKVFICSFGSVFDSNEQINTYINTRLVSSLVCAIVRYYLKKNPSVNKQKGYGGVNILGVNNTKGLQRTNYLCIPCLSLAHELRRSATSSH